MGIFDFLGDIGSSVLGSSPAKDVREHIEKELPGLISDLNVGFNQGTVTLSGDCDCQATKEKAILLAGNIKGVTAVDGDRLVAPAEPETGTAPQTPETNAPAPEPEASTSAAAASKTPGIELPADFAHQEMTFYTIKSGDSLSKIAKSMYGDAAKYPFIFEANREVIKDPDLIYPGQTIRIPKLD